jgi:hypothetical protein
MLWEERPAPELWFGSFSPTNQDSFVICIKCNDQCLCKDNSTTRVHQGGEPSDSEVVGEARHDVPYLAGCSQVRH